jgi:hypothetical protein
MLHPKKKKREIIERDWCMLDDSDDSNQNDWNVQWAANGVCTSSDEEGITIALVIRKFCSDVKTILETDNYNNLSGLFTYTTLIDDDGKPTSLIDRNSLRVINFDPNDDEYTCPYCKQPVELGPTVVFKITSTRHLIVDIGYLLHMLDHNVRIDPEFGAMVFGLLFENIPRRRDISEYSNNELIDMIRNMQTQVREISDQLFTTTRQLSDANNIIQEQAQLIKLYDEEVEQEEEDDDDDDDNSSPQNIIAQYHNQ